MSYAVARITEYLEAQIQAAPRLELAEQIPGPVSDPPDKIWKESVLDVLIDTNNKSGQIQELKAIEGGRRRYSRHCLTAVAMLEPVKEMFAKVSTVQNAQYDTGELREKALARLKELTPKMIEACRSAIKELQPALRLLEEGDFKAETQAAKAK